MQRQLRAAIALVGLGAATVLALLAAATVTGSLILGITAGVSGVSLILAVSFVGNRILERASRTTDRLSTRIDGMTPLRDRLSALENDNASVQEQLIGIRKQLKVLRNRVPAGYLKPVQDKLHELTSGAQTLLSATFESAVQLNRDPKSVLTRSQARDLFQNYLLNDELLQLRPLIENFDLLGEQNLSTLRRLYQFYRKTGYWDLAVLVIQQVYEKSGLETDARAEVKLQREIEVFSQPERVTAELQDDSANDPSGPILHMVGRVLPETQTGYTLRTQYTALAQARKGLPVAIVGQSGITAHGSDSIDHYHFQGIDYYILPGPARIQVSLDEWLRENIRQLAGLARQIRPSILHAQSDFFNALIINAVGKKYGIPTVYESRGFWEYSWLSRTITANKWHDPKSLFSMYGLPSAYEYRKHAEEIARSLPDHVFTLADVMRDHILESGKGKIGPGSVTIVPNAVESSNFPIQEPDLQLAAEIGLPEGVVTIGYISSMVEYEGIDTLVDAFHLAKEKTSVQICLLLVGDGDYLPTLRERVEEKELENVYFTGRVPHEDVLRYYGLIDVFVVPRKPSTVADLVTPLKPFEAFSTGRAVILSDVGALREIAEQSRAVETFRAGDAADLAHKLIRLIHDPERRKDLSDRAARWVRNHRSWDNNVNEYYRVYKQLGYNGPQNLLIESEISLTNRGVNPGELLESLAATELPALRSWFIIEETQQSAASILDEGWRYADFEPVMVSQIDDWTRYGDEDRSWGFHLHAWEFMDPLLCEFDKTGQVRWLDEAIRIALCWIKAHWGTENAETDMAWYDMSLSLRTPRLIALTLRAARLEHTRDEAIILAEAVGKHLDALGQDRAFTPHNNHGFYTAISQVHAAKYVGMYPQASSIATEGRTRLAQMAATQFASDGAHLEHSPEYHRMLLKSFERAINDNLIEDIDIKRRVERATHALGWMVQPDGVLVQFGDTPAVRMVEPQAEAMDPHTQYILSDGASGEKPHNQLAVYAEGGYAFVRSPQPNQPGDLHKSGYLAFSAAFHSRTHKHADDLNVVWYDRGQQILTDSGRYGYGELLRVDSPLRSEGFYYASPKRQYVESTMAHNTLMIDGLDQDRRIRKPYGSGIGKAVESEGTFDLTGRVQHLDYVHRRRIIYRPGAELLLLDSVYSQSPESREGVIWLNIAEHFEIESVRDSLVMRSVTDGKLLRLRIDGPGQLIEPVRGQENPLRGWRSKYDHVLRPSWSVGFKFSIETRASVKTRLKFID